MVKLETTISVVHTTANELKFKSADKSMAMGDSSSDTHNSMSDSKPSCNLQAELGHSEDKLALSESQGSVKIIQLPWYTKCFFALGGAPYQMLTNVIGFFVSIFLLNVAGLHPALCSVVLLGGRVCDALTDPLIGVLVEKSPSWRLGRLKSWMMFSMPFTCIVYYLFWYVPEPFRDPGLDNYDLTRFAYYFVLMLVLQLLFTCHQVPFSSLTMYISNNKKVRDSATAVRMAFEMGGVLVGVIVASFIIQNKESCKDNNSTALNTTTTTTSTSSNDTLTDDQVRGSYQFAAIVLVAVHAVCVLCVMFGVKEHRTIRKNTEHEPFLQGVRRALGFRPYVILMFAFLQIGFVMQNVQANLVLYVTYTLELGKFDLMIGMLTMLFTGVVCVPLWQMVQHRYGKKVAFAGGLIAVLPALFAMLVVPPVWVRLRFIFYPLCAVSGASVSVAYLCPWSMLPDVIDAYFLHKGVRQTSVFYSFYVFFSKLAVGVAIGVSQAILAIVGYENGACKQPEQVGAALRYLISVPSLVAAFGSLICVYLYPINETVRQRHDAELRRIKQFDDESSDSFGDSKPDLVASDIDSTLVVQLAVTKNRRIVRDDMHLLPAGDFKSEATDGSNSSSTSNSSASSSYASSSCLSGSAAADDARPLVI